MSMTIGKVIKSNSHVDYVCQVYGPGEVPNMPRPEDYALGTWVKLPAGSHPDSHAVGLVYDTQLYNPDYGTFGPRLSSPSQLEVFSPDYLSETATLVGLLVVGQIEPGHTTSATSGYCPVVAQIGAPVTRMTEDEVCDFHSGESGLDLSYYSLLLSMPNPLLPPILVSVLDRLEELMPGHERTLRALRTNLSWRTRVDLAR